MPIRWNKNGERYTNGNLRIQRSTRSYSVEIVAGKTFRPYNPSAKDIFHLYDNGQYIGQTRTSVAKKNWVTCTAGWNCPENPDSSKRRQQGRQPGDRFFTTSI